MLNHFVRALLRQRPREAGRRRTQREAYRPKAHRACRAELKSYLHCRQPKPAVQDSAACDQATRSSPSLLAFGLTKEADASFSRGLSEEGPKTPKKKLTFRAQVLESPERLVRPSQVGPPSPSFCSLHLPFILRLRKRARTAQKGP